jgi:methionyl aminopeptidase
MNLKEPDQIKKMREAGLLLWETHQVASRLAIPDISTKEIDREIENFILTHKAIPMFKGVPGKVPYPAATCISINEQVVHGIPSDRKLKNGDIVSFDIGLKLNGWCADAAVTYPVGAIDERVRMLLTITENALRESISLLGTETKWSLIVKKTSRHIEKAGFSIVEDLVGHAIGREMWEKPQVPNYYSRNNPDFRIKPGLVLAIEPMVNMGTKEVETLPDYWTIVTKDNLPSAHFEHTIAVTDNGPVVLTCGPDGEGWAV